MKHNETILTPKNAEKFNCKKCVFKCSKQSDWNRHILTLKHKNETNEQELEQQKSTKCQKIYECECGNTYKIRREK